MNALTALTTGVGIGLATLGGLWLSIRCAVRSRWGGAVLALSQGVRLLVAGAGFYAVARQGAGFVLPALAGFWLVRSGLVRRIVVSTGKAVSHAQQ